MYIHICAPPPPPGGTRATSSCHRTSAPLWPPRRLARTLCIYAEHTHHIYIMYNYSYTYNYKCINKQTHIYIYMCVYIYIYIYIHNINIVDPLPIGPRRRRGRRAGSRASTCVQRILRATSKTKSPFGWEAATKHDHE